MKKLLLLLSVILVLSLLLIACNDTDTTTNTNIGSGEFLGLTNRGGVVATLNGHNIYEAEFNYYFGLHVQSSYEQMGAFLEMLGIDLNTREGLNDFMADNEYRAWELLITSEAIRQIAEGQLGLAFDHPLLGEVLPWGNFQFLRTGELYMQLFPIVRDQMMAEAPTDAIDARAIYDADPTLWDSVLTSHILIFFDQAADDPIANEEAVRQQALDIIAQLNAGANFAELAREYSECPSGFEGGLIDNYINVHGNDVYTGGSFFPEYVAAAHTLTAVGEFTQQPVRSHVGYHIIIAEDIRSTFEDSAHLIGANMDFISDDDVAERIFEMIAEFIDNSNLERHQDWLYFTEED